MNIPTLLDYLSNMFLLRSLSIQEIEYWHNICFDNANKIDRFISYLLNCKERENLLSKNPKAIPVLIEPDFPSILNEIKKLTNNPAILTFVVEEYLLGMLNKHLALHLFLSIGIYDFKFQSLRMLEFAVSIDHIQFINLLSKIHNKFPKECETCTLPLSYKAIHSENNLKQSNIFGNRLIINLSQELYQIYTNPHLYSLDESVSVILTICKLNINSHYIYQKIESIIDTLMNGNPVPALNEFNLVPIYISGFWFSGSSAITDFLLSKEKIYAPFFKELELYRLCGTIPDIIKDGELNFTSYIKRIIIFFAVHVCNIIIADQHNQSPLQTGFILSSEFTENENAFIKYLDNFNSLAYHLHWSYKNKNMNEVRNIFLNYLCNISLRRVNKQHKYLLLDNAIAAQGINALKYTPDNSIQIIVFRDPRDQYISLFDRVNMTPLKFINYMNWCLNTVSKEIDAISQNHLIIPISYEKFVLDEGYRHRLADKLDLDEYSSGRYFFPKRSATRIGKWHSFPDQGAMNYIAESLPQLLDHSFINIFKENIED